MITEKLIAEKLLQVEAIKFSPEKPFTWASGWKSPIYCDNRKVLSYPYVRDFIKSELCSNVFEQYPDANVIAGVATAGIAWGALIADQLKLPFMYVRPKPKEHGLGNQIEGYFEKNQKVVVVEDLISTGKSSLQVVDVLRNEGLEIMGMISIFQYQFNKAIESFKEANVEFSSLTNYSALLQLALDKNLIQKESLPILNEWRLHPDTWQGV